ncbi:MAG: DUF423 domain-containing protein [Ignavibacteriaceae bacterium]
MAFLSDKTKKWIVASAISGFLAVALGAFGAHGLKDTLSSGMFETYKTGVLYHLVHSVVLLMLALSGKSKFSSASIFFITGIILFSFSLYLYAVTEVRFFAVITPFGGVSFLTGWVMIIVVALK